MKTKHFGSAFVIILTEKEQAKNSMIINKNKQILYQKKTEKKHTKITARFVQAWWNSRYYILFPHLPHLPQCDCITFINAIFKE